MKTLIESLENTPVVVLSEQNLEELLNQGEVLKEVDTHMRDMIRLVDWQGTLLIQETTNKDEFVMRKMTSQDQAEDFIQQRLDAYDRMWDG